MCSVLSCCQQLEGDTLAELSVAGHGVVLTLLSLLKQTTNKTEGTNVGMSIWKCCVH